MRAYNIARVLSDKHQVSLLSFYEEEKELDELQALQKVFTDIHLVKRSVLKSYVRTAFGLLRKGPLQVYHYWDPQMALKVKGLLDSDAYDAIYIYHLRMAQYVQHYQNAYKILDFVDSISLFMQRMYKRRNFFLKPILWLEWKRVCNYERYIAQFFNECWIVSDADRREIQGNEDANIQIIPQAIDFTKFVPVEEEKGRKLALMFVGYMGTESISALKYFIKDIFPMIKKRFPKVKLYIVGANPPVDIIKMGKDPNVIITGFVESLVEYYRMATVVIAPMRFVAGMQTKIIEAMAMKKPVVATSWSNEGIDAVHGRELFIGDTPERFAEYVIELLSNPGLRREMGGKAAEYVKKFSWSRAAERMDELENTIALFKISSKTGKTKWNI